MVCRLLGDRLFLLENWGTLTCCLSIGQNYGKCLPSTFNLDKCKQQKLTFFPRLQKGCGLFGRKIPRGQNREKWGCYNVTSSRLPGLCISSFLEPKKTEEANEELPRGRAREAESLMVF